MSFFPHIFRFTESGNRLFLLYLAILILLIVTLYSIYQFVRIKFVEKQPCSMARKYILYILVCIIVYSLTFIPVLELRLPIYRGEDAPVLAETVWNFINSF